MKIMIKITGLLMGFFMAACGTSYEEPETAIDAGRQFISAIYNGNFKRAGQLIVQDEANALYLESKIEKDFRARDGFGKEALSKASIQIMKIKKTDSTHTLLLFKNAYSGMNTQLEIKMVEGLWKVNLLNNP
jgi:hypothetical protein